jgi:transposase InsO family protein
VRKGAVKLGVGTKLSYDGELVEVVEMMPTAAGNQVVLRGLSGRRLWRVAVKELLSCEETRLLPVGQIESADDEHDQLVGVVLAELADHERDAVMERAAHIRELLTGYRSGTPDLAGPGEPRKEYRPDQPLLDRYSTKAAELDVGSRTLQRWVQAFRESGEAGLVEGVAESGRGPDQRWVETALEVMIEHTDQSRPSRTMVIDRTNARVTARFGPDVVKCPSRSAAFRALQELERRHPTFRLSTKRNRDIADRPHESYGKLRPTRPGEYLLMDTTRLDVFALDPVTLRWVQAELTAAMDWYTRCVVGILVTPVSTKAVDAAATLYQAYRPPPAGENWPLHAVWPEHGVPRSVLVDRDALEGPIVGASGPAIVPETLVVDHGKIYISEHLTSVCQRMGISIQPARVRTGRDKGPVERFFRTVREDLLQALPGYKRPRRVLTGPGPRVRGLLHPRRPREHHPRVGGGDLPPAPARRPG